MRVIHEVEVLLTEYIEEDKWEKVSGGLKVAIKH
jgi:hypothetical protein